MDDVPQNADKSGRLGFWERLRAFFGVGREKKEFVVNRFAQFVDGMDKKDAEYRGAVKAVEICDESLGITVQRVSLIEQLKDTEKVLLELNCFEDVTDEDAANLKELMARLKGLTRDKTELKSQISVFDPNLERMAALEGQAKAIAPEIKDAEKFQRMFRHDIHALRGEKSDLEYERESLIRGEKVVRRFMFWVLGIFVLCVLIFGFSAVMYKSAVAVPLTILTILAIAITALLIGFRRRFVYELELNLKKQQKAVGMLNKKNAVFAHYTNFLNFTYKKYRVRNSDMLKKRLKEYDHYRHLTRRYDALRKMGDETENELNKALVRLKIPVTVLPLDNFARVFNLDEKRDMHKNAVNRKASIDKTLKMLDERQARLWDQLTELNRFEGGVVDSMIKFYMEEAGRIILNPAYISDGVEE
ncbi:MAG: hypothetical protein FWE91_08100 [Defluviitaleaceae bacterium]|nr:hypothetical protein [Defluviitaleaceae bacterium]MCL2836385.1 hypothetical protein [Defluviitaleaceae bacterium]